MIRRPPRSTLFPYTTLFRSAAVPAFDDGNNPIFTLNAFAFTGEGDPDPLFASRPDLIVFGDGVIDFLEAIGIGEDRKSTRLNSSHANISYAVFCLKKKNNHL